MKSKLYPECDILGPYFGKDKGRYYIQVYKNGVYICSMNYARYLMQEHMGRLLLDEEHVDHIDDNKTNDVITNLQILTQAENNDKTHRKYETQIKVICFGCGIEFAFSDKKQRLWEYKRKRGAFGPFCTGKCASKFCANNRQR